jgi:hypothetical protein
VENLCVLRAFSVTSVVKEIACAALPISGKRASATSDCLGMHRDERGMGASGSAIYGAGLNASGKCSGFTSTPPAARPTS